MAKSPEEMAASMIKNLKENTDKDLDQWLKIGKAAGKEKHGELLKYFKSEHGVTHGFANLLAHKVREADGPAPPQGDDLVDAQYSGPKAGLRPIYDSLIAGIKEFGNDVEISPKKAYVSLRRNKQFGLIQSSAKTRVDVGINLKGVEPEGRFEASGSFNAMVSHRVKVTAEDQVDDELLSRLKQAYDVS